MIKVLKFKVGEIPNLLQKNYKFLLFHYRKCNETASKLCDPSAIEGDLTSQVQPVLDTAQNKIKSIDVSYQNLLHLRSDLICFRPAYKIVLRVRRVNSILRIFLAGTYHQLKIHLSPQ